MNTPTLGKEASAIEHMTHVQKKICMMWGTPELDVFLNSLMMDSRDGQRKGFPVEVTQELLFLAEFNKFVRAIDLARKLQIPLRQAYEKVDVADRTKHDTGIDDPLSSSDSYGREAASLAGIGSSRGSRPTSKKEEEDGGGIGPMIFSLLTNKAVLFLFFLAVAYKLIQPYLTK